MSKPKELEPWKSAGKTWTFWQYTQNGDGLAYGAESKSIDLNWFNGDLDALKKFASSGQTSGSSGTSTTPTTSALTSAQIASLKTKVNTAIDDWKKNLK